MAKAKSVRKPKSRSPAAKSLMVRLDDESKRCLNAAADLRQISVSDYVRSVLVAQARHEVESARSRTIVPTPDEQREFWAALNRPAKLTPAQRRLGAVMRGES
jgi:uncharacterized protein (DUF1778 family)